MCTTHIVFFFFFSSRRRHTRFDCDWSSDVCSSDLWQIQDNDQAMSASEYIPLIVGYHNGAAVRLGDIAQVSDSVQDLRNDGLANGDPAVMLILFRQPGANIIATVDRVRALLPHLRATIPASISLNVYMDRTPTIRASLHDVE